MALICGCAPQITGPRDTGLEGLTVTRVDPGLVLPGTLIVVTGQSFVPDTLGATQVRVQGMLDGATAVDFAADATVISDSEVDLAVTDSWWSAIGNIAAAGSTLDGQISVEVTSTVDKKVHSASLAVTLQLATQSTPTVSAVGDGVSFVNQPTEVDGGGFLLGGGEGTTQAELSGCFQPAGQSACGAMTTVRVPASPMAAFDRTRVSFPYATSISGIGPGTFDGTLALVNVDSSGNELRSATSPLHFDIQKPAIFDASTTAASLGQYVVIAGGGFVGGEAGQATLLALKGSFTPDPSDVANPQVRTLDLELVPQFVSGPTVRYVLSETDPLGQLIDLRTESGLIAGTVQPIVDDGSGQVSGDAIPIQLQILPIKQVVLINFLPSYVESLRKFGMRAADPEIRQRVLQVAARDYNGVNMDFRATTPDDFALYSTVDLAGPDPNGEGLLGYDNTPGKDTGNLRLYDHIGGVNAVTEEDGSPGYGGVFVEGFFGFSRHPNGLAAPLGDGNTTFDPIFDPFRPDVGGVELTASELAERQPPILSDGDVCPARDRATQISCAIWALGNMIGTTMTHEVGHSLGLANPYGPGYHDAGDLPNRLMEVGSARPFNERAEIVGAGPGLFCDTEYSYLQTILPSTMEAPAITRPPCN